MICAMDTMMIALPSAIMAESRRTKSLFLALVGDSVVNVVSFSRIASLHLQFGIPPIDSLFKSDAGGQCFEVFPAAVDFHAFL